MARLLALIVCALALLGTVQCGADRPQLSADQQQHRGAGRLQKAVNILLAHIARASVPAELGQSIGRLGDITNRVVALQTRLDSSTDALDTAINSLNARLDSVNGTLESTQTDINSQLAATNARFSALQDEFNSLEAELDLRQESTNSSLASIGAKLDTLDSGLETCHASEISMMSSVQTDLAALNSTLISQHDSVTSGLVSHQNTVGSLETGLTAPLDAANSRLGAVTSRVAELVECTKPPPRNCQELPAGSSSGVYQLQLTPDSEEVDAYCDMETDGGGWTVVQRRADIEPRQSFKQDWETYKAGFGSLEGEFWWGLEKLSAMTFREDIAYELRFDLGDWDDNTRYAVYQNVRVAPESDGYRLTGGQYSGTAGNELAYHFGMKFSTKNRDQDGDDSESCAHLAGGGWWYNSCYYVNPNGVYYTEPVQPRNVYDDIIWGNGKYSLKTVEMKIRPTNA